MSNKLIRVFDWTGPLGLIPNGLNYKYLDSYTKHDFINQQPLFDDFIKKFDQVSVYDCHHNIDPCVLEDVHVSKYLDNKFSIYPITAYGSLMCCLGRDFGFHMDRPVFDFISEKSKEIIRKQKNLFILLDYSSEGDIREDVFEAIHVGLADNNIPASKLIFICSALNTLDIYKGWLSNNDVEEKIKVATYPWAVMAKAKELNDILTDNQFTFKGAKSTYEHTDKIDFVNPRKHKFLLLNRRLKPHRVILLSLLEHDGLLKDNLVSFDLDLLYCKEAGLEFESTLIHDRTHRGLPYESNRQNIHKILKGYKSLKKRKKQIVDKDNIDSVWGFGYENKEDYQNTYFSVVSETLFYETGTYLSEKIFKPIAHCHPFVLISRPNSLEYLKIIGFKTFSDFWDESYDTIVDDAERMNKIYDLIKQLTEKSDEEWVELYKKIKPILIYNRNHLLKFQKNQKHISEKWSDKLKKLAYESIEENYSLL